MPRFLNRLASPWGADSAPAFEALVFQVACLLALGLPLLALLFLQPHQSFPLPLETVVILAFLVAGGLVLKVALSGQSPDLPANQVRAEAPASEAPQEMVPVCSWCRKVRDGRGRWVRVEKGYLERTGRPLTHGLCPDCARDLLAQRHEAA